VSERQRQGIDVTRESGQGRVRRAVFDDIKSGIRWTTTVEMEVPSLVAKTVLFHTCGMSRL
jgi:hypothetical protein